MENPNIYAAVKRCIYCGTSDAGGARFGDEHIIPEGLAGQLVLKEASCRRCEATINTFETRVMRTTFEAARRHLNIRSKKKGRKRPQTGVLGFPSFDNRSFEWRDVDLAEHPFTYQVPIFVGPGLLTGHPVRQGEFAITGVGAYFAPGALANLQAKRAAAFTPFIPDDIARFVAKIAHAYAVAQLGIAGFQPLLLDTILGRDDNIALLVGSGEAPTPHGVGYHQLGLFEERGLLVAAVKLFAGLADMPTYIAVVGTPATAEPAMSHPLAANSVSY